MKPILYNDKEIASIDDNFTKVNLTFHGEKLIYDLINELCPESIEQIDLKLIDKQVIKTEFLKRYIKTNNLYIKIKPKHGTGNLYCSDKLILYKNGWYDGEYTSKTMGIRNIQVVGMDGEFLSNTHMKKAINMVLKDEAVWIEKNKKIQLKKKVSTEVTTLQPLRNILYKKQKKQCNLCKNKFELELLDLHHKYIPQTIKTINYFWNTELVCKTCHKNRHLKKYSLVNILIKLSKIPFLKTILQNLPTIK